MLKASEIQALSNKLNFDIRATKHCLKDLFSKDSSVIDNTVVSKNDVVEFLRICTFTSNKKERDKLFYTKILRKLSKKDPKKTIPYFLRDSFFSVLFVYLDKIENIKFDHKIDYLGFDQEDTFYITLLGTDYMNHVYINSKKSEIIGALLAQILDTIDFGEEDFRDNLERDYIVKLSSELVKVVGYRLFIVDWIRDIFCEWEDLGRNKKGLDKTSYGLMSYRKEKKIEYIFIYCLCESLKKSGYKAEDIYKKLVRTLNMDAKTIRRRYYDIKREMKDKGFNYKSLIKIHNLQYRIYETSRRLESSW